jgi:MFS family permease
MPASILHVIIPDEETSAQVFSTYAIGGGVSLVAAPLVDIYSRKWCTMLGVALLACAALVFGLNTNPTVLFWARFMQGVSATLVWTAGLALIAELTPSAERGAAFGIALLFKSIGLMSGPLIGGESETDATSDGGPANAVSPNSLLTTGFMCTPNPQRTLLTLH